MKLTESTTSADKSTTDERMTDVSESTGAGSSTWISTIDIIERQMSEMQMSEKRNANVSRASIWTED